MILMYCVSNLLDGFKLLYRTKQLEALIYRTDEAGNIPALRSTTITRTSEKHHRTDA
jgi:hypothetical protein